MTDGLIVPGIDATTPLGFLAALGALRILDERAQKTGKPIPRLAFRELGRWRPVLDGAESLDEIVACVNADLEAWSNSPILSFRYVKVTKKGPTRFGGLTPPLSVHRGWMQERLRANDLDALEYGCALIAETATQTVDGDDLASPDQVRAEGIPLDPHAPTDRVCLQTPFDFSSRNMQFLDQINFIREAVLRSPIWIERELLRDETVDEPVRTMGWDTTAKAPGAQYPRRAEANRPTTEWLAFRGLVFLPVFGRGRFVRATSCRGRRLDGDFIWPVWKPFATAPSIRSLLAQPDLRLATPKMSALRAMGVAQLFQSHFAKLGKYDAIFTPTEPIGGAVAG